ncbi:glycosyltransferase family 4 protein [Thermospira aquatica]|uniref:Glycosyltransferase family 4 protein n=1 Tax=Thermospira aquatica TaxID=2828656 RepID=A0AAX3BEY4_9SPIR|nr:glycosyltransferase family 1 protein [Thermospira aquatica]URA10862.1 glycosyltransferase family 4 protein [Thermospira aquatica]
MGKALRIGVDARPLREKKAGIGRYVEEMVNALSQRGEVELVLFSNRNVVLDEQVRGKVTIVEDKKWKYLPGTLWYLLRIPGLIQRYGIEIFWGTQHALPFTKPRGCFYVVTWHDLVYAFYPETMSWYNRLVSLLVVKRTLAVADSIVAVSETTKRDLLEHHPFVPSSKVSVIYEGKSLPDETSVTFSQQYTPYLFLLGSLEPRKNILSVLEAFRFIKEKRPDLKLVITGGRGWKKTALQNAVDRHPYRQDIVFTGYVSDETIVDLFKSCEAFLFPSLYEGFGLPLLEAEEKCPVIVNDIPVFRELGRFFENLFFCDFSEDSERVADDIFFILSGNPARLLLRGEYREIFTWEYAAQKMVQVLGMKGQ